MTKKTRRKNPDAQRPCSVCHKIFSQASSLVAHMRTHSGEKPYSCIVCDRKFTNAGNRKTHMRVHTGEKPFKCMLCSKGFSQQNSLKAHIRIHNGEKPFSCDRCSRSFRVLGNLKKHMVVHSDSTPFSCNVCDKKFKLKSDLKRHQKACHRLSSDSDAKNKLAEISSSLPSTWTSSPKRELQVRISPIPFTAVAKKKDKREPIKVQPIVRHTLSPATKPAAFDSPHDHVVKVEPETENGDDRRGRRHVEDFLTGTSAVPVSANVAADCSFVLSTIDFDAITSVTSLSVENFT